MAKKKAKPKSTTATKKKPTSPNANRWAVERELLKEEFERVRLSNKKKTLLPEEVVKFAEKNPESVVAGKLTWDDAVAAHHYRVEEARRLIQLCWVQPVDKGPRVRQYVSLDGDRSEGRGYRKIETVLNSGRLRQQLLDTALREMELFQERYQTLHELVRVFEAMTSAKVSLRSGGKKAPRNRKPAAKKRTAKKGGRKR